MHMSIYSHSDAIASSNPGPRTCLVHTSPFGSSFVNKHANNHTQPPFSRNIGPQLPSLPTTTSNLYTVTKHPLLSFFWTLPLTSPVSFLFLSLCFLYLFFFAPPPFPSLFLLPYHPSSESLSFSLFLSNTYIHTCMCTHTQYIREAKYYGSWEPDRSEFKSQLCTYCVTLDTVSPSETQFPHW